MILEAQYRDEFTTPVSPQGLKVVQVATDSTRESRNVYMDCNSWTADSKRFTFWRLPSDDGAKKGGLWLCDTENGFAIEPVLEYDNNAVGIEEFRKATRAFCGACMAPDGACVYEVRKCEDTLELTRISLCSGERHLVGTAPAPLTIRGVMTISCDGKHLLIGVWLGDGKTEGAPWGAYVFDVEEGTYGIVEFGNGFRNMHCQYSKNPDAPHDVLLNGTDGKLSDGSWLTPPDGSWRWQNMPPPFPPGEGSVTCHHVVQDDGCNWRMLPIANGADLISGGHNGFRGTGDSVFCAVYDTRGGRWRSPVVEATPVAIDGGRDNPEYWRGMLAEGIDEPMLDLSRKHARADSCHLACDRSGKRFVSDTDGYTEGKYAFLWVASYVESSGEAPWLKAKYLLLPRSTYYDQPAHAHPVLSPDGRYVVFQSDFSGRPQVYVAYDFAYP